jgi:hypothetical protein
VLKWTPVLSQEERTHALLDELRRPFCLASLNQEMNGVMRVSAVGQHFPGALLKGAPIPAALAHG